MKEGWEMKWRMGKAVQTASARGRMGSLAWEGRGTIISVNESKCCLLVVF